MELEKILLNSSLSTLIEYVDVPYLSKVVWWSLESDEAIDIVLDLFKNNENELISVDNKPTLNNETYNEGFVDWNLTSDLYDMIMIYVKSSNDTTDKVKLKLKIEKV